MTDREIYEKVRTDALAAAGGSLAVHAVVAAIDVLYTRFGEEFTLDGASFQLQKLINMAAMFAVELQKAKESDHV